MTIRFLGPVDDVRVPSVSDAVAAAASGLVDVPVRLAALGAFPSARRARVVWAGMDDPAGGIGALTDAVGDALAPLGFEREAREFTPHVTLARLRAPGSVALDVAVDPVRFVVDRATLFQSHLGRGGARYESLAVFPFRRAV